MAASKRLPLFGEQVYAWVTRKPAFRFEIPTNACSVIPHVV